MDFAHPCDHEEVYELLNDKSHMTATDSTLALVNDLLVTKHRTLFVRMKCTLTTKGRNINIKSAAYRVRVYCFMQMICRFQFKQEGQHPLTGQRAPPISGGT